MCKEEEKPQSNGVIGDGVEEKGDVSFISEAMAEEEQKLLEDRMKMEEEASKSEFEVPAEREDPNFKFTKLDELLTQTQLYSEFLLEKMDDITFVRKS